MKTLFILFFLAFSSGAQAYAVLKASPVVSAGTAGNRAIVQVAQPYTFTGQTAANAPFSVAVANDAQYALGSGAGSPASKIAQAVNTHDDVGASCPSASH